jgi:hypothetical protein
MNPQRKQVVISEKKNLQERVSKRKTIKVLLEKDPRPPCR